MKLARKPIYYETTCTYCGAVIRFDMCDTKETAYNNIFINCPNCGEELQTHYDSFNRAVLKDNVRIIYDNTETGVLREPCSITRSDSND